MLRVLLLQHIQPSEYPDLQINKGKTVPGKIALESAKTLFLFLSLSHTQFPKLASNILARLKVID